MTQFSKRFRWPVMVAAVFAAAVGAFMAYVAIQHNPQEEYCVYQAAQNGCAVRLGPVAELFVAWFVPCFVVALIIAALVNEVLRIGFARLRR